MIGNFIFNETTPSAPGTLISSRPVQNSTIAGVAWPLDRYEGLAAFLELPLNNSGGALDVYLQSSPNGGIVWADCAHYTHASLAAATVVSFPMSLWSATTAPIVVGENNSPALSGNKIVTGAFTDRLRLVMVAGAGTTSSLNIACRLLCQGSGELRT